MNATATESTGLLRQNMDKLRRALSGSEDQEGQAEQGGITEILDHTTLSWSTRVKGFAICFVTGFALSLFGSILFFFGNYVGFGISYSLGSVISIFSTMFLMGPVNQCKKMFDGTRVIAALIMWCSIILTLFFAFKTHKAGLVLLFVIIQFFAMTWYSISFIPFARDGVKKFFSGVCL